MIEIRATVKYGRLRITGPAQKRKGNLYYLCECDCGNFIEVLWQNLRRKNTKSCGCFRREFSAEKVRTHGQSVKGGWTRVYRTWACMVRRCSNSNDIGFPDYGGRGIGVCERWKLFENFFADMGNPLPKTSIERIDINGNYCPENCRWATQKEQARNKRNNVLLTYSGKTQCVSAWAEELGMSSGVLGARVRAGWGIKEALTPPKKPYSCQRKTPVLPNRPLTKEF